MAKKNNIKDLGKLKYFLRLKITSSQKGIYIGQRKYALDLLESTGYLNSKPSKTPASKPQETSKINEEKELKDLTHYRSIVVILVYLTVSRPDITFVVNSLSQSMAKPKEKDLNAAHKVLRYIKQSPGSAILFSGSTTSGLRALSDSDWASCPSTRRSTTGFAIYLVDSLISWQTKKQHTVARSSTEVEYRDLAYTSCEITWMTNLLKEIGIHKKGYKTPTQFTDNNSAVVIARNPVLTSTHKTHRDRHPHNT